jgi:histidinol phosphatase-like enzyme
LSVGEYPTKNTLRADATMAALHIPLTVVFCTAKADDAGDARKPGGGKWEFYARQPARPPTAPPVDLASSFYVGDAAGRPKGANTALPSEADPNDADAAFAAGVGLAFKTPEEIFGRAELRGWAARAADYARAPAAYRSDASVKRANARLADRLIQVGNGRGDNQFYDAAEMVLELDEAVEDLDDEELKYAFPCMDEDCMAAVNEYRETGGIQEAYQQWQSERGRLY